MIYNTSKIIVKILPLICVGWLCYSSNAFAQYSISERTYKKLEKVEKYIDQKDYKSALSIIEELQSSSANKKYELTLVYLARGRIFYDTNQVPKAIDTFEKGLSLHAAPQPVTQNLRLNLIQAYATANNYQKAIEQFTLWLNKESSPSPDVLALGGSLYAYIKQYEKAIGYLKQAIAASKQVSESWYRTLLSIYFEKQDFTAATKLLQTLISQYPDNKLYWTQLFSGYYLLNDYKNALSILELAYTKHYLSSENDITNLVKLYLYRGIPAKAIIVLKSEMDSGHLEKNEKYLQLLANAYVQSREWRKAAETYQQLAIVSHDQKYNLNAAQLFAQAQQWQSVIKVLAKSDSLKGNGQEYMLIGRAQMELNEWDKAIQAFKMARSHESTRVQAEQWIRYLQSKAQI